MCWDGGRTRWRAWSRPTLAREEYKVCGGIAGPGDPVDWSHIKVFSDHQLSYEDFCSFLVFLPLQNEQPDHRCGKDMLRMKIFVRSIFGATLEYVVCHCGNKLCSRNTCPCHSDGWVVRSARAENRKLQKSS